MKTYWKPKNFAKYVRRMKESGTLPLTTMNEVLSVFKILMVDGSVFMVTVSASFPLSTDVFYDPERFRQKIFSLWIARRTDIANPDVIKYVEEKDEIVSLLEFFGEKSVLIEKIPGPL